MNTTAYRKETYHGFKEGISRFSLSGVRSRHSEDSLTNPLEKPEAPPA